MLWTHGVREGRITENLFVALLSTNQARVHGMRGRKGVIAAGADADIVVWDPDLTITATQSNRHGNVDYTPFEGMTFTGGPASVYIRGSLAYQDGEVVAAAGLGPLRRAHVRDARRPARRCADGPRRPHGLRPQGDPPAAPATTTAPSASRGPTRGSPRATGCASSSRRSTA